MMMHDEEDKEVDPAAIDALSDEVDAEEEDESELGGFDAFGKEEEE